jgi:hypothetical protein
MHRNSLLDQISASRVSRLVLRCGARGTRRVTPARPNCACDAGRRHRCVCGSGWRHTRCKDLHAGRRPRCVCGSGWRHRRYMDVVRVDSAGDCNDGPRRTQWRKGLAERTLAALSPTATVAATQWQISGSQQTAATAASRRIKNHQLKTCTTTTKT